MQLILQNNLIKFSSINLGIELYVQITLQVNKKG